jgi:2-oxoglutarate ferredoxin oxidoreductase subunit beta
MLFNNEIYGLTKGQYSPTSKVGTQSPSTPTGSLEAPVNACSFALGAGGCFVARSVDTLQKHLQETLVQARGHRGASFVEIMQNCIVYNDNVFGHFTDKSVQADAQIHVEHGKPLIFGKNRDKGLRLNMKTITLEAVTLGEDGVGEDDLVVHDKGNLRLAQMLAAMEPPHLPVAMGVLYDNPAPTYEGLVYEQNRAALDRHGVDETSRADLNALMRSGHTWNVD